jgi:hypothetical protein
MEFHRTKCAFFGMGRNQGSQPHDITSNRECINLKINLSASKEPSGF